MEGGYPLAVRLAGQWQRIEQELPERWEEAGLALSVGTEPQRRRALSLLATLNAGRSRDEIRFRSARRGAGPAPAHIRRLLGRLDAEGIEGHLALVSSTEAPGAAAPPRTSLAERWRAALAQLPPDWSDLYVEVELFSSDYVERGALLLSPVNPALSGGRSVFRFRAARLFGYGASPDMVGRCLERLDEAEIRGNVRILRALSDTKPVATQGPVWYVGGKSV